MDDEGHQTVDQSVGSKTIAESTALTLDNELCELLKVQSLHL